MRRCLALMTLLLVPVLLVGDEKKDDKKAVRSHILTKEEIAEGWLLLFDGETTFGWKIDGEAKVEKGVLILGGEKETKAIVSTQFGDHTLRLQWQIHGAGFANITINGSKDRFGKGKEIDSMTSTIKSNRVMSPLEVGVPAGTRIHIHAAALKPDASTPLFNGKDLTGWKVFTGDPKREKSTYSVTKEGWLNVKDGPGDIQTTKTFADFVLQFDCISNGKHLNSGLFFRALPGEYWMGYEAQIRNEFKETPQKYTLEEFEPKTNKLLGKKEITSPAFDYGTGAIYRRMPARKQVSKDGEWFTMTIVARERHIATWVNGIQQVDWTDHRQADKNPRKGYTGEAGALSIQGHDKTTDLSFRNLRIGEMKRGK